MYHAILMPMRMFLMLLIFAIGFSGYSAAAHAFGPDSCDPAAMEKMMDQGTDVSDCPEHQADQDKQKDSDTSKTSKAKCIDCTHCCTSHAINFTDYSINFLLPLSSLLSPRPIHGHVDEVFFYLLRPPKSLV